MHYHTTVICPYCGRDFIDVNCKVDFPVFYISFIRCDICANWVGTGYSEFLTVLPEDRLTYYKPNLANCKAIEESLDRTNNKEYVEFLKAKGYNIYPVTEEDKVKFKNVDFDKYENALPSEKATKMLYDAGVLIEEEKRDELTGGYKIEVLQENQKQYVNENKAGNWSIAITIISIIILICILGSKLDVVGVILGLFGGFVIGGVSYYLIKLSYDSQTKDKSISQEKYYNQSANNKIIEQQVDDDSEDDDVSDAQTTDNKIIEKQTEKDIKSEDVSYETLNKILEDDRYNFMLTITGKPELDELSYKMKEAIVTKSKYVLSNLYLAGAVSDEEYKELADKIKDLDNLSHK